MTRNSSWRTFIFNLALLAYPGAFRRRFGEEMRADFRRERRPLARTLPALLANGLAERGAAIARWSTWPTYRPHLYEPEGSRLLAWDSFILDVRHTLRLARKARGSAALAVIALGLGIGVNTAVFTVFRGVLLRPLPYSAPDRLLAVWSRNGDGERVKVPLSPADFLDLQAQARGVADLEAYFSFITNSVLAGDGHTEVIATTSVTGGLLPILGRTAALGRTLIAGDGPDRAVLSDGFWRRRFGSDPNIVGRTIQIDSRPFTVVGVMPPGFVFPYKGLLGPTGFTRTLATDAWIPLSFESPYLTNAAGQPSRDVRFLGVLGRLDAGVTADQAAAAIAGIAKRLEREYPASNKGWTLDAGSAHEQVVGGARPALLLLVCGAAVILLMACINVANMVLARSVARQRELAIRAALGASRWRLTAQALVEGLMLAGAGAVLGLVFLSWSVRALVALAPGDVPRLDDVTPDLAVLVMAVLITTACGVLVSIGPAVAAGRTAVNGALQKSGRALSNTTGHRTRVGLATAEIALAVVLTIATALLLRSFAQIVGVNPGFDTEHVLTLQMNIPERYETPDARRAFYASLFQRLESLPGVLSVGGSTRIPLGSTNVSTTVDVEGRTVTASERPEVEFRRAMHDYFNTMQIPIVRGRSFTAVDGPAAPPVAIVNQAMARRVFPDTDPIGKRIRLGPNPSAPWTTIVGVVGDVRHGSLEEAPAPEVYINYLQNPPVTPFIVVRGNRDPVLLAESVRAALRTLEPQLPLYDVRTMKAIRSESLGQRRFLLVLIGIFGALALTLAAVGVYGVMSLMVSERTHELGVRLALGASPVQVAGMLLGGALAVAAAGAAIGVAAAAALAPLMKAQLFEISARDPLTFVVVPAVLIVVAVVAALVPARKAMWIDPIRVLRAE